MKKLLSALIVAVMFLSLAACAGGGKNGGTGNEQRNAESQKPTSDPSSASITDIKYGGVEAWNIRAAKEFQILIIADEKTTEIKAFEKSGEDRGSELSSSADFIDLGEGKRGFEISLIFNDPGIFPVIIVPFDEQGDGNEQTIEFTAKTDPQITAPGIIYTISSNLENNYMPARSDLETPNSFGAGYRIDDAMIHLSACKMGTSNYANYEDSIAAFTDGFEKSDISLGGIAAEKHAGTYSGGSYYAEMIVFDVGEWTYAMSYDTGDPSGKPHISDYETLIQSIEVVK